VEWAGAAWEKNVVKATQNCNTSPHFAVNSGLRR